MPFFGEGTFDIQDLYADSRHYRNEKTEIAILRVEENDRLREEYFQEAYYDG